MQAQLGRRNRLYVALSAGVLLAVVAGWGWALTRSPDAVAAPAAGTPAVASAMDPALAAPLVRLMSPGAVQTEVQVLGVMAGGESPLALLAIGDAPPIASSPGQWLGPSTQLLEIGTDAIVLAQQGQRRTLPVPQLPAIAEGALIAVPATAGMDAASVN